MSISLSNLQNRSSYHDNRTHHLDQHKFLKQNKTYNAFSNVVSNHIFPPFSPFFVNPSSQIMTSKPLLAHSPK